MKTPTIIANLPCRVATTLAETRTASLRFPADAVASWARLPQFMPMLTTMLLAGCGDFSAVLPPSSGPLFQVQLIIEGRDVGGAILDTGGGYELLLREHFGLDLVDTVEVLAFGGMASVDVTAGFAYSAGGVELSTKAALVDGSICGCNGLGFHFLRKTGLVLALDFVEPSVTFIARTPRDGTVIPFERGPGDLANFDTAFIAVDVTAREESATIQALLDTGAASTVMRRGLVGIPSPLTPDRLAVEVGHPQLGTVVATVSLFDTPGLPDMIIGTDIMRAWGGVWYFDYAPTAGSVVVLPRDESVVGVAEVAGAVRALTIAGP